MSKIIYIKYGDLVLKGNNKNEFINRLIKNIKIALKDYKFCLDKQSDNLIIREYDNEKESEIINILKFIPGIQYIIEAYIVETDLDKIYESIIKTIPKTECTFKIELKKRVNIGKEHLEIKRYIASKILEKFEDIKVDVHNPNYTIMIELKEKNSIYYYEKIKGLNGLPIGLNGSTLSLISGGIDSPVASFLMQKKGLEVNYITFVTTEVTEKTINKIKSLIDQITLNDRIYKPKFYIVDFTKIQHELTHAKDEKFRITLMRRSFYRIAEKVAKLYGYDSLCCGDSLGQVASQTIESMTTINDVVNNLIVFRPLLSYDKYDIINLAKYIGTYDISILDHEDICSLFAPKNPATKPTVEKVVKNEEGLELLELMEERAIQNIKII